MLLKDGESGDGRQGQGQSRGALQHPRVGCVRAQRSIASWVLKVVPMSAPLGSAPWGLPP